MPAGVRVFDHSNAIEGDVAEACYSAAAFQPASVEFKTQGAPPAGAGRVDGIPAGVVLFDSSSAIEEPAPVAVSIEPVAAEETRGLSAHERPALSADEELRRLLESLEVVDEEPAHTDVEIDLTSAIALPAGVLDVPAESTPSHATETSGARAGGGKRRRGKGRGRKDARPVEPQSVTQPVEAVVSRPEPPKPVVQQAPPPLRVLPPRQVASAKSGPRPRRRKPSRGSRRARRLQCWGRRLPEPAVAAAVTETHGAVAAVPQGARPGDVASAPLGRVHHASPAIEATLPHYAPWLMSDPLPPGAAEATPRPKSISLVPGVGAGAPDVAAASAGQVAHTPEPQVIRLAPAPDRAPQARSPQGSETATAIRPAPAGDAASTGIRLAPAPESARPEPSASPLFGTSFGAPSSVLFRAALDERDVDVAPMFALASAARDLRATSTGHWPKALVASVAVILIAGAAFGAYWYAAPSASGTLSVQSSVAGVEVLVDGRGRGNTPLKVDLTPGRHVIEMRGFGTTRTLPVEITAGVLTTQNVKWPAGRQSGTLKVTTAPAGASVKLDGEVRGVTPVELEGVTEGTHTVAPRGGHGDPDQVDQGRGRRDERRR